MVETKNKEAEEKITHIQRITKTISEFRKQKEQNSISKGNKEKYELVKVDNQLKVMIDDKELELEILYAEYKAVYQREPLRKDGHPTKDFLEWINKRNEFIYLQYTEPYKNDIKDAFISRVALLISKTFRGFEINSAIQTGSLGNEVHGFIEVHFPHFYEFLIDNDVLYRALYLARKNSEFSIITYTKGIKLKDLTRTRFPLRNEQYFNIFPEIRFKEVIFLSKGSLSEALTWDKKHEVRIEEYPRTVEYAVCNTALLTFTPRNIPILLVTYAIGKMEGVESIYIDPKEAGAVIDDINARTIRHLDTELKPIKAKLETAERKLLKTERENEELKYELEKTIPKKSIQEKYYSMMNDESYGDYNNRESSINWKKLGLLILFFTIIGLVILGLFFFVNILNQPSPTGTGGVEESMGDLPALVKLSLKRF